MTIGAANVHAFIGMNGPYWSDLDGDQLVSWAFDTGNGDEVGRTIQTGSIKIGSTTYTAGQVLPVNVVGRLSAHHVLTMANGAKYGDINNDGVVDANETEELNNDAKGLWIDDFDFGMAIMRPTNPLDFAKYFALKANANGISLVGIQDVTVQADNLVVEINQSTPSVYGVPLFPVVDFATTYPNEQQALFDVLAGADHVISAAEMGAAFAAGYSGPDLATADELVALLHVGGAPPGTLTVNDVIDQLATSFATDANLTLIKHADIDNDGKFDPAGYEVDTGGTPVYLDMDSALIRAQGFLQLSILDNIFITGSVAFELGPTHDVMLTNGATQNVTTMTIGAADVTAFIGANGPYWTDSNGDHEVQPGELNQNSVGFAITDLDVGIALMVSTSPLDLGVYLAGKLSVHDFGLVGVANLTATGTFDVELNVGIGASGLDLNLNPIDFDASFDEVQALFDVMDTSGNHVISTDEMSAALSAGYTGGDVTTVQQLLLVLGGPSLTSVLGQLSASFRTANLSAIQPADADGDGRLNVSELQTLLNLIDTSGDGKLEASELDAALSAGYSGATLDMVQDLLSALYLGAAPPVSALSLASVLGKLSTSFKTAHLDAIQAADANADGKLDFGFNVNTGNPTAPVVLDFNDFLVSIRLGGVIELKDAFRMTGLFLFEADTSGLKAFVAAGLEIGPDIGSSNQIFAMNALGALMITHSGVAADIEVSVSIGGALSDVLQLNAKAQLLLNTTGQDLTITIPKNYVDFLIGNSAIPDSPVLDSTLIGSLTTEFSNRLALNTDGSATFTISGTAPDATTPGFYLVVTFHAELTIARMFVIEADFRLEITDRKFDLGFDGTLKLGGFGSFGVSGGAVIDQNGFAAYGELTVDINLLSLVEITGEAQLKINTATSGDHVTVNGHDIANNTYLVSIQSSVTLFGVVKGAGDIEVGLDNGVFVINVNDLSVDLFILNVGISGYIRSDGQFNLTGSLSLPDALKSSDGQWGITGHLSVTISNSGFKGHGDVGIIVFGQSFNVASADLSITTSSVFIRAEGPLGVYIEITIDQDGHVSFDGGLGFLDELIDAVKDAVNAAVTAVGDAVVTAANAVADAFTDLGNAILDLGSTIGDAIVGFVGDVGDFLSGIAGSIAQAFSSSRTIAITFPPTPKYSYSTALSDNDHTLTIDMSGGNWTDALGNPLTVTGSPLSLAVVNGQLVVDGPDASQTLLVAERQHQTRSWDWGGAHWGSWHNDGDPYGFVYADIQYSNMKAFNNITKVIILGTSGNDTIVLDTASITQDAVVYGYAGNDTIITGNGNDYVSGGDGNDIIYTYGGNDVVYGGGGNDTIVSGTGNDAVYGGDGNDVIDESQNRGNNPKALIGETNTLDGGAGDDVILGSPGKDTIDGETGNDTITGLANDDTYVFENGYGKDVFADFSGKAYLDFSAVTDDLEIGISDGQPSDGLVVNAGTANSFSIQGFIFIQEQASYSDFQIAQLKIGAGNDHLTATALPLYALNIVDAGGHDTYDFDLNQADVAQSVARIDIVDNGGNPDLINLDVDSTGFDIYLHPQEVLLNHLDLTFNSGVEQLHLTDHAAGTTITTMSGSGFSTLLIKNGVTITQANGGDIELDARGDFTQQAGSLIETTGNVVIRSDVDDVDPPGAVITLLGPINANQVTVCGTDDNDTVIVGRVTSKTDVYAGAGDDTINVGTPAPGTVDGINGNLNVHGEDGSDILDIEDTGDANSNTGVLTATTVTGLDMTGIVTYESFVAVNVGLGAVDDKFTIESTHAGTTVVSGNDGNDVINIQTISGPTTVNGGNGSDTFNVGSKAPATGGLVDGIAASLTINGNDPTSGSDTLNVDETGDATDNVGTLTSTQVTGLGMAVGITYGTIEHLVISLGSGDDKFTIGATHDVATPTSEDITLNAGPGADTVDVNDATMADVLVVNGESGDDAINMNGTGADGGSTLNGDDGGDVINLNAVIGTVIVNGGDAADTVNVNDVTDVLVVNGGAGGDTINVNGTRAGSSSTLNGDAGDDVFNVRAINGPVAVNGGADNDTVNVADTAPLLPPGPRTTPSGTIDDINALLDVDGGNGVLDTLNIDDSNASTNDKNGTLTDDTLTGLELEVPIHYLGLEQLNIWLGSGANVFTINSTQAGETTVNTAKGADIVYINGASGVLTVNGEEDVDTFDVRATGVGSEVRLNGQEGADTFNLSDLSPALPAAYPATLPPPAATTSGKVDSIDGLVAIDGGADSDTINIDDSGNTANKVATLTSNTLRGLDMPRGVNYSNAEDFNLWLGTGTDGLYIDSTHAGTTNVFMGDGNATVNERDDTVAIRSISGVTTVHGQGGNDSFYVGVQAANDNFDTQFKQAVAAAANDNQVNALFHRTNTNGIGAVLNLHGEGDSDQYTVNLAGEGDALINVFDNGAPDDGVDTLTVNGADVVSGLANNPNDTFLLRRDLVALLNDSVQGGGFTHAERVNYDENINARLIVNGLGGNDKFVVDDNSAITTLDGGDGDDTFQIGQVFGTPRTAAAGLDAADTFDTTPIIIGTIRDPNPAHWVNGVAPVLFDPTLFDPVNGVLSQATIDAINAAIAYQAANGNKALDGVAYVSSGATHAITAFGGGGNDTFSVYHNKATLRLEGEEGNDQFVVRAFVTLDLSKQGDTEVNGGDGTDTINYAINAPVSIDGGAGFDKVVVLGTPFNDNFVVTSHGIFGANLNVTFENIESAELDTLEGNDTIFVLGTNPNMVTTVIGGLGSDTIQVLGDVTQPIVSNEQGRSGVITQGLSSADPNFDNVGTGGVAVNVLSAAGENLVKIDPVATPLLTAEDGVQAFYFISLVSPDASALAAKPVYLTVSAGVASSTDRKAGGAGVLVSADDGATFTNAVVLKFDGSSATTVFKIRVKAINDTAAEGPRIALISHSIVTDNAAYRDLPLIDVAVSVIDDDQPGLDIRHLVGTAPNTFAPDVSTQVLEGASGFSDVYSVALIAAPAIGETVTVTLSTDGQVTARSKATGLTQLTFTAANWNTPQLVVVSAVDDTALEGTELSTITHQITSTGGKYSAFPSADYPKLTVTVYDNETPGLVMQETDGSTVVVENGANDSYQVRLTSAPSSDVTLTIRTDKQTFLSSSADTFRIVDESGTKSYYEYAFTFTAANWDKWATINVRANPVFAGIDSVFKAFPPQDQNLDQIRGPLIIEGGIGSEGADRSLRAPVLLPNEIDSPSNSEFSDPASEPAGIDTLNVFHTDNDDADVGRLYYRETDAAGHAIRNPGLALTGFEMGGDLVVNQGTIEDPDFLYFGGGITYNGLEVVEVLLGKGNETLTIDDTGDRDEKAQVSPDPATITAIHGGGGDDTIIANNRGHGPLVLYGDTSLDGTRYSNDQPAASANGTTFNNPGNDTIDASRMPNKNDGFAGVVIYGGTGNDTIFGGQDDDHIAGGAGNDAIDGGAGNDHIYGDAAFDVNLLLFSQDQIAPFNPVTQLAQINGMFAVTSVGATGADIIRAGDGNDIVLGDHGVIEQAPGTRRLQTTDFVARVTSVDRSNGAADTIYGGGGEDVLIGGASGDRFDGEAGRVLIFCDNVRLDRTIADGKANAMYRTLTGAEGGQIYSTFPGTAGDVLVNSASGGIPSGGAVWEDFNIELLEHDFATQTAGGNNFGNDYIAGGADDDEIFGELGNDVIQGDGSIDYAVSATRSADGTLLMQPSMEATTDGNDYIEGNGGNDVIFGNLGQDDIIGGSSSLFSLTSPAKRPDGSDMIFGGAGIDIARDNLGDGTHGRDADVTLGDNGNIYRIVGTPGFNYDDAYGEQIIVRAAQLLDYTPGGPDYNAAAAAQDIGAADEIHGESGDDVIYAQVGNDVVFGEGQDDQIIGGYGSDWISGGTGDDAVLGDDGRIFVSRNSTLSEPLYGIAGIPQSQLNVIIENSNGKDVAITNVAGALKYTVDLTPYSVDPANAAPTTVMPRPLYANDIIYGGQGNDTLHGGAGEDAISGAEAPALSYVTNYTQADVKIGGVIRSDYVHPVNPGNVLGYNPTTTKFALYDADDPLRKILLTSTGLLSKTGTGLEWALNFNDAEGPIDTHWIAGSSYVGVPTDGDDVIFGDLGSDWMVGGTGRDTIWSGWGDDLANLDDKLSTFTGPDTNPSWEDLVFGGAGRDVMIGNTGGDRLIDWNGEFNSYWMPYNPFGAPAVSRGMAPAIETFLLALSKSQGADPTLASQYGGSAARNGEPFGETGMVRKGDAASGDQNGGPRDPQGPVVKAKQDVKVSAGIQPQWETAAESVPLDSAAAMSTISEATLATIVEEAKLVWTEMLGVDDGRLAVLNRMNVQFGNLPGDRLGLALGVNVYIDSDAAGRGWQTMDLLSVVAHELGHLLGFDHNDAGAVPVMNETLEAGARNQFAIAGNVIALSGLAGFVTGADNAQQVIGLQPNDVSVTVSIDGFGSAGWTMLAYSGGDVGSDWKGAAKHHAYGVGDEDSIDMDDSQTMLGVDNQPGIAIEAGTGASDVATKAVHLLRADLTAALNPMPRKAASVPRAAVDALVAMSLDWTTSDFQGFPDLPSVQKDGSRAVVTTPAPDDWVELSLATAGGAGDEVPALGHEGVDWRYAFDGWLSHGWRKSGPAGLHQPP
jgi:Ca2+-binding RTX toxin-like protein